MLEAIRQFYDKKSPLFIITISILIADIILLGYDIDPSLTSARKLKIFEVAVLVLACVEVVVKTVGMEIFKRCFPSAINQIHVVVIFIFMFLNKALYVWSIFLNLGIRKQGITAMNEPHQFFMQIYSVVFTAVYLTILGLLISLKLENQTMTVLQDERNNKLEISS